MQNILYHTIFDFDYPASFKYHKDAIVDTPYEEGEVSTVPYARSEEYDEKVEIGSFGALPVSSEGDIKIFSKPCRERNMPPAPEFCYAL